MTAVVAQLGEHWRVVDDGRQWALQYRADKPRWYPRQYFSSRDPLVAAVTRGSGRGRAKMLVADDAALYKLARLPDRHPGAGVPAGAGAGAGRAPSRRAQGG